MAPILENFFALDKFKVQLINAPRIHKASIWNLCEIEMGQKQFGHRLCLVGVCLTPPITQAECTCKNKSRQHCDKSKLVASR